MRELPTGALNPRDHPGKKVVEDVGTAWKLRRRPKMDPLDFQ